MIRGIYQNSSAMQLLENKVDVIANNLANISTAGYKRRDVSFQQMIQAEQALDRNMLKVNLPDGFTPTYTDNSDGRLKQTGNPLDLAIEGNGFFEITLPNGDTAYSRNGAFKVDSEGTLVNGQGFPLAQGITLETGAKDISISENGLISYTLKGNLTKAGPIQLFNFINPAGLSPQGNSLFSATNNSGDPVEVENNRIKLRQGMLESSNVKLVNEMVDLITAQRAYEANSKSISTTDQMLTQVNQLKR